MSVKFVHKFRNELPVVKSGRRGRRSNVVGVPSNALKKVNLVSKLENIFLQRNAQNLFTFNQFYLEGLIILKFR
jgi:hypothetical protein